MTTEKLSKRQLQLLLLLYRFRFLTNHQMQQFLNHKNPTRIQQWLKQLNTNNYILSDYDRSTFETNRKPAIYCLASNSKRILEKEKDCDSQLLKRIYKEKTRSQAFKERQLVIADFYFLFVAAYTQAEKLVFFTSTDLVGYDYLPHPFPDAYIAVKNKTKSSRYFLEVLDETIKKSVVFGKVTKYFRYIEQGDWQAQTDKSFPKILFIAPDERRRRLLKRSIQEKFEQSYETELQFFVTTREKIQNEGLTTGIWEKVAIE